MKTRVPNEPGWIKRLNDHREQCGKITNAVDHLQAEYQAGKDIETALSELAAQARALQTGVEDLYHKMVIAPLRHMFSAHRLNLGEEEYWRARAAGFHNFTAKSLGVSPISDYEACRLCVYENDKIVCFWHPDQTPPGPHRHEGNTVVVHGKAALSPEEIDVAYLRPEQIKFIRKHRPDILPRLGLLKRDRPEQPDPEVVASPQRRE